MALILLLEKAQYFQGSVRLYSGDAWNLGIQVADNVGGVNTPKDLSGAGVGVTAYFPTSGADMPVTCVPFDAKSGRFLAPVPQASSPLVTPAPQLALYAIVDGIPATGNPMTAQMPEADLTVLTRSFSAAT